MATRGTTWSMYPKKPPAMDSGSALESGTDFRLGSQESRHVAYGGTSSRQTPHHKVLRPFILDTFIARVGDPKTRLITESSISSYLSKHFMRFEPPNTLHDMFCEADFRSEGCLTESDIKACVTGLYKHRKHTADWERLVSMITEELDIFWDKTEGGGMGDAAGRRSRKSSITFGTKSTTHFHELENMSKSMRIHNSGNKLLRTIQGVKENAMGSTEERVLELMGVTGGGRKLQPVISFDAKQEYLVATGREALRDRLSRSQTASASLVMVRDGKSGKFTVSPSEADPALFRTGKLRHMPRPGTGGPANFKLYTRPLSTIDSDFKKTLGKPLDLRTVVDAEVTERRTKGETIDYVAKMHDRNVTSIVAGREQMLLYREQGMNLTTSLNRKPPRPALPAVTGSNEARGE